MNLTHNDKSYDLTEDELSTICEALLVAGKDGPSLWRLDCATLLQRLQQALGEE